MGAKIRHAEIEKIPYMLVVGEREVEPQDGLAAPPQGPARAGDPARGVPGRVPPKWLRRSAKRPRSPAQAYGTP